VAALTPADVHAKLAALERQGDLQLLERESRHFLSQQRYYLWHMYLIVALLRTGRRDEAARELDDLMSYKFNIAERAFPEIKAAFPEKFEGHFILDTMKAEVGFERGGAQRRGWTVPYPIGDVGVFGAVVDKLLSEALPALPSLERTVPVTTFGSCFAANLARMFKAAGVDATNLLIEESINSPLANRAFLTGLARPEGFGHMARLREVYGEGFLERARSQLAGARVIVVTLGVAPAFFEPGTDRFVFLGDYRALLKAGKVEMRTPPVGETKQVIGEMLELLRALNPGARIYLSISPVPLYGTAELANAILADCVSKTTLRAALHEVLQDAHVPDVHYWPSFEIVRWLGAHTSVPAFGADDGDSRHVSNWLVEMIVDRFSRHLFGTQPEASQRREQ
jgi:hypothetical protein